MNKRISNRYEFVLFFDVKNGNPNGDPDAGNMPRVDPETGHGITTDVSIKRKIRNYVDLTKRDVPFFEIHVKEGEFLAEHHKRAHAGIKGEKFYADIPEDLQKEFQNCQKFPEGIGIEGNQFYIVLPYDSKKLKKEIEPLKKTLSDVAFSKLRELLIDPTSIVARAWMCKHFYDIRTFGAVMNTGDTDKKCGQVRGPVQLTFGESVEPVKELWASLSRTAAVSVDEPDQKGLGARKAYVPYGLYRVHGFISAPLAKQTGFTEDDLKLFWEALKNMFDHDRSAARGEMATRKLIVFKHASELGSAPAHKLFETVKVVRKSDSQGPAREFSDYDIILDKAAVPAGIEMIEMV